MRRMLAVFNTNQVNRYGMVFPASTLESALSQAWNEVRPAYLSHDVHQPIGLSRPVCLYVDPSRVSLLGESLLPTSDDDQRVVARAVNAQVQRRIETEVMPHFERLRAILGDHADETLRPLAAEGAAVQSVGLVGRALPDLFTNQDKHGLVPLGELDEIVPGVYRVGQLAVFAHPYLRRSLSRHNSLNAALLRRLGDLAKQDGISVRILLDPDAIALADSVKDHIELEYWWGPKFKDTLGDIVAGVCTHEADARVRQFHGLSRTEFWWYTLTDRRSFECEELLDRPSLGVATDQYGCRFVHSILDAEGHLPDHLDGAIRMYTEEEMVSRLDVDISKSGKKTEYTKLWRVDGAIKLAAWKEIVTHHFRDNPEVGLYLGGTDPATAGPPTVPSVIGATATDAMIPCRFVVGDGVRVAVSYHELEPNGAAERSILPTGQLYAGDVEGPYIETDTLELVKTLRRRGGEAALPPDVMRVAFEDLNLNLPRLRHSGLRAVSLAIETEDAINAICKSLVVRNDNRQISWTTSIVYPDREVWFSIVGTVKDACLWLESVRPPFPTKVEDVGVWIDNVGNRLEENWPNATNIGQESRVLDLSGGLRIKRHFVSCESLKIDSKDGVHEITYQVVLPYGSEQEAMKTGDVEIAPAWLLRTSTCSRCDGPYEDCLCSKFLDESVHQKVTDADLLGAVWTDRSALSGVSKSTKQASSHGIPTEE